MYSLSLKENGWFVVLRHYLRDNRTVRCVYMDTCRKTEHSVFRSLRKASNV